jgi:hypothetical protein
MDALVDKCLKCEKPLPTRRKLKGSYSCRGRHAVDALDGPKYQTGLVGSKNTRKNEVLRSLKRQSSARISFAKTNSVSQRIGSPSRMGSVG